MDPIILGIAAVNGVLLGGLYGAVALGLSLIFGVMRVINFAHGTFLMIGLFIPFWLWQLFGVNPYVSALVAVPALFALGYLIQSIIIAPLFKRERAMVLEPLSVLLLTAGVGLILDNLALMAFGPNVRAVQMPFASKTLWIGELLSRKSRCTPARITSGTCRRSRGFARLIRSSCWQHRSAKSTSPMPQAKRRLRAGGNR